MASVLRALALAALLAAPALAVSPISGWTDGTLTFYGGAPDGMDPNAPSFGTKEGSCGYGDVSKSSYPYYSVAALSPSNQYYKNDPLNGCGECFQIQCTGSMDSNDMSICVKDASGNPLSILVMISDECPECGADHIDTQALAFSKIANPSLGNIRMQYRKVECAVPEDMKVSVMNYVGSNGWLRLTVEDTGGYASVTEVQVRTSSSGSSWTTLSNTWGATWELSNSPPPPLDIRITCVDGQVVEASTVVTGTSSGSVSDTTVYSTGVQFTINDPAMSTVTAASGDTDPMVVDSSTPGNTNILSGDGSVTNTASAKASSSSSSSSSNSSSPSSPSTSSPSASPSSPSASPSASCTDVPPDDNASCAQRLAWGQCSDSYLTNGNYCADSCGRCANGPSSPTQSLSQSPSSPGSSPASSCADIPPDTSATCDQRVSWGQCDAYYVTNGNYCAKSCGRCGGSSSPGYWSPEVAAASVSPSPSS